MIQRSKIDVIFFPGVFDAMLIFGTSQSLLIREVMRDILQSRYLRSNDAHKQLARTFFSKDEIDNSENVI